MFNLFRKPVNYIDFEILNPYGKIFNAFSMSQDEIDNNFEKNLIKNLSEVMLYRKNQISVISVSLDISKVKIMDVIFEIRKIQDRPKFSAFDLDGETNEEDDFNPYQDNSWAGCDWHCIRCGSKLQEIAKDNKIWGDYWETMEEDGTLFFLCSNQDCSHSVAPLVLHHPIKGYTKPAGDSYSISWVK